MQIRPRVGGSAPGRLGALMSGVADPTDRCAPNGGMSAPNNLGIPNCGEAAHNDAPVDGVTLNCGGCVTTWLSGG
jgi:hypothetical protein